MIFRKGSRKYSYQGAGPGDDIPVMPCANLDTENSRTVLELFQAVNQELKQTIVMVSHEPSHMEYFDRIIFIRDGVLDEKRMRGEVRRDGPPRQPLSLFTVAAVKKSGTREYFSIHKGKRKSKKGIFYYSAFILSIILPFFSCVKNVFTLEGSINAGHSRQ